MNNTRTGKIARLPKYVRDVLGDRLEAGEQAADLVKWLNSLLCVQEVLKQSFGSRLITVQNLSEWRQGGHQDWLRREQARLVLGELREEGVDLDWATGDRPIGDRLARRVAAEMVRLSLILLEQETDPVKRWERLCQVNRELSLLRRDDDRAAQRGLRRERFDCQMARAKGEEYAGVWRGRPDDLRSGPERSSQDLYQQEHFLRTVKAKASPKEKFRFVPVVEEEEEENFKNQNSNFREDASAKAPAEVVASPAESGQIQPNPTKSNLSEDSARQRPTVTESGKTGQIQEIDGKNGGNEEEPEENSKLQNPKFREGVQIEPAESGQIQPNPTKSNLSEKINTDFVAEPQPQSLDKNLKIPINGIPAPRQGADVPGWPTGGGAKLAPGL